MAGFIRTGKTNLTDDELIVFDALFDLWCLETQLKKENFASLFNFSYEHALSHEELSQTLVDLKQRKLIKSKKAFYVRKSKGISEKRDVFSLTSEGGRLWSKERLPDWQRYCSHSILADSEASTVEVLSPSQDTLERYVEAEREVLAVNLGVSIEVAFKPYDERYLVPWKRFPRVYAANWKEPFCSIREFNWKDIYRPMRAAKAWSSVNDLLEELASQDAI